jgi:hypothetical protein
MSPLFSATAVAITFVTILFFRSNYNLYALHFAILHRTFLFDCLVTDILTQPKNL